MPKLIDIVENWTSRIPFEVPPERSWFYEQPGNHSIIVTGCAVTSGPDEGPLIIEHSSPIKFDYECQLCGSTTTFPAGCPTHGEAVPGTRRKSLRILAALLAKILSGLSVLETQLLGQIDPAGIWGPGHQMRIRAPGAERPVEGFLLCFKRRSVI
jgi:hypothetical protein